MSIQQETEEAAQVMCKNFDSATVISITIAGLLSDQYDTIEAQEYENEGRNIKMSQVDRAWIYYHKRVD